MRVIIQRVTSSSVSIEGEIIGQIGQGLNLLVGITTTDTDAELAWMARKCLDLRLFPDPDHPQGRFEKSVLEIGGELLVVSQFTLYGDTRKGRRPSYDQAAPPAIAAPLYDQFVHLLKQSGLRVATGQFGAMMSVAIANDGPVTLIRERNAAES